MDLSQAAYLYLIALVAVVPFIADLNKKCHFEVMALIPILALVFVFVFPFDPWEPLTELQMWNGHRVNVAYFALLTFAFIYSMAFANRRLVKNLTEGASRLEAILEQTSYIIWSVDAQYNLVHANHNFYASFKTFTGIELQTGDNILDALNTAGASFWKEHYDAGFNGQSVQFEYSYPENGIERTAEVTLYHVYNQQNEIRWVSCYSNNITESKKLQHELEKKTKDREETMELAHIGSWYKIPAANQLNWDARTAQIMGVGEEATTVAFDFYAQLVHPADVPKVMEVVGKLDNTRDAQQLEYRIITPDGRVKYIFERAKPVLDSDNNVIALQGYTQDLTELRSEAVLNEQTRRLLEAVKDATEMLLAAERPDQNVADALRSVAKAVDAGHAWLFAHFEMDGVDCTKLLTPDLLGP